MSEMKTSLYTNYETNVETEFKYKTELNTKEKIQFVSNVCNIVIADQYFSFLKELIFNFEIINIFTNVDVSKVYDSDDYIGEVEKFVMNTNIAEIVKQNVNNAHVDVIEELYSAVDENIAYQKSIHSSVIETNITNLLNVITNKIENIDVDSLMTFAKQLSPIAENLSADKITESYANSPAFLEELNDREQRIADLVLQTKEKK